MESFITMTNDSLIANHPLTETTFFILLSLSSSAKHGYAIAKDVESMSEGRIDMSTSTLYTALKRLLDDGWIKRYGEDPDPDESGRPRKTYILTALGRQILNTETMRLQSLVTIAESRSLGEQV
jgi:DNA-binding PadR family transcriptional regulator